MASGFWRSTARMTTSSAQLYSRQYCRHNAYIFTPVLGARKVSLAQHQSRGILSRCPFSAPAYRALQYVRERNCAQGTCYATLTAAEPSHDSGKPALSLLNVQIRSMCCTSLRPISPAASPSWALEKVCSGGPYIAGQASDQPGVAGEMQCVSKSC